MIDLIKDIQEWHEKTFPEFTAKDQEMKLGEEISEYCAAIDTLIATGLQSDLEKIKEELADVIIAAVNLCASRKSKRLSKLKWQPTNKGLGKMDTTADYKALYLKKFFQWQDICHQQSIKIEELKKEITELKKQIQLANDLYLAEQEKNLNSYEEIYNLKEENKRLLRANWRLVNRENAYYLGKFKELKAKLKTATNAIQSVINEPDLMDAGMLMFLTSALNKIKE